MTDIKQLSICIPTYNRADSVKELVQQIIDFNLKDMIDLIVIDDASNDKTYEKLLEFSDGQDVRILKNEKNLSQSGTFLRCFKECRTEYLLVMFDDEFLFKEGVLELMPLLDQLNADFISTQWDRFGSIDRPCKSTQKISIVDIDKYCSHAPGLVYRKSIYEQVEPYMTKRFNEKCLTTFFYPQYTLLLLAKLCKLKLYATPILGGGLREAWYRSGLVDPERGEGYQSLTNIVYRYLSRQKIYKDLLEEFPSSKNKRALELLIHNHKISFYFLIQGGLEQFLKVTEHYSGPEKNESSEQNPHEDPSKNDKKIQENTLTSPDLIDDFKLGSFRASITPLGAIKNLLTYLKIKIRIFLFKIFE